MLSAGDTDVHLAMLVRGSKTFSAAGRFLPRARLASIAALYAYCRASDDLVDESPQPGEAVEHLERRLDAMERGESAGPIERGVRHLLDEHGLPPRFVRALHDGYRWDAEGRAYETVSDVRAYGVRVAGTVGVAMTWLFGARQPEALSRAVDLGVAMQLTNIARDVGEDARLGRLYLPREWLGDLDPRAFQRAPRADPRVWRATCRVLDEAELLYARAESGIGLLPWDVQPAILAAARMYRAIGHEVRRRGPDALLARAVTTPLTKLVAVVGRPRVSAAHRSAPPLREAAVLLGP